VGRWGQAVAVPAGRHRSISVEFVLAAPVLARALHPFPSPLRTLDAIHLSTVVFLMEHGHDARLASYGEGMLRATEAMGISGVAMP
jgi:hypothetical protein